MVQGRMNKDFRDIGHSGGKYKIKALTENGRRYYQVGITKSSPTPMSCFIIVADFGGNPLGVVDLGWNARDDDNEPKASDVVQVFIGSDRENYFGHQCPECEGYWRSPAAPARWPLTCPYCGVRAPTYAFLTQGQRKYVAECCAQVWDAIHSDSDVESEIDMDKIADEVQRGVEPPSFYYAEQGQQCQFQCSMCGTWNDVLGRFAFCSCCGNRNGRELVFADLDRQKESLANSTLPSDVIRNAVSILDAMGTDYVRQLLRFVHMTPGRRKKATSIKFHDLDRFVECLKSVFDIDVLAAVKDEDASFLKVMFQRRHVHEHKGGVVDQKYIDQSGDRSMRVGQVIREENESAIRFCDLVFGIAAQMHDGFHSILPLEPTAIKLLRKASGPKPSGF